MSKTAPVTVTATTLHPAGFAFTSETCPATQVMPVKLNPQPEAGALDQDAAAAFLGLSVRTLQKLRNQGKLAYLKIGARVVYPMTDLIAYIQSNRIVQGSN